ncbi:MAG: hypothetical protein ACYTGP_04775 [Planctomycetota bacterium]|jgi:hypothetical protein
MSSAADDTLEPALALDDEGRITADVVCCHCGYDLRGLRLDDRCPECSAFVGGAVHGSTLDQCSEAWVALLRRGTLILAVAFTIILTAMPALSAIGIVLGLDGGGEASSTFGMSAALIYVAISVLFLVAIWMLTTRDPGERAAEPFFTARRLARLGAVTEVVGAPVDATIQHGDLPGGRAAPALIGALVLLYWGLTIVSTTGHLALFVHLRNLTRRIPRPGLAKWFIIVAWMYAPGVILIGLAAMLMASLAFWGGMNPQVGLIAVFVLFMLGFAIAESFGIWMTVLVYRLWAALRRVPTGGVRDA